MALSEQLASFFATVKFNVDDKGLKKVDSGIQSLGQRLLGFKSVASAVGVALQQVMSLKFANITAEEEKCAKLNGVLRENVDELKLIATQSGITQETVTSAISQIARQKQDLVTMKSIPMWVRFGVDPRQSPDKVLKDILKKVKNFTSDTQRQMALLSRLGISREFALAFKEGNFEIDEATKKLLKFKQTNAESSIELTHNVSTLKALFSGFLQGLNGILTPIMNLMVQGITKVGKELFVFIEPILRSVAEFTNNAVKAIKKGLSFLSPYILFFLKVISAIALIALALKGVLAILGSIKLALIVINLLIGSPVLLIGAITAAVLALWKAIDESSFKTFMDYTIAALQLAYELVMDFVDYLNGVENTGFGLIADNLWGTIKDQAETTIKQIGDLIEEYIINPVMKLLGITKLDLLLNNGSVADAYLKSTIEKKAKKPKSLGNGLLFGALNEILNDVTKTENINKNVLPREQQGLGKQEVKKTNRVENNVTNEITVNTQNDKPFDLANLIRDKVSGINYQTKIDDENDTAGLTCNVEVGAY